MNFLSFLNMQQNYNRFISYNIINSLLRQSRILFSKNNGSELTNGKNSTDADSLTSKNNIIESKNDYRNEKIYINLRNSNEFVEALFNKYNEENCLCNYLLFEKSVNLKMNIDEKDLKTIFLLDYFEIFKEVDFLCLNVPFLKEEGNIEYNTFSPTLSSMSLFLKTKKIINENANKKYMKENFTVYSFANDYIKIEFDETNPPFNRDIIDTKIKIIHQIIGKKRIALDKIDKDQSYVSILWTPADPNKIKTSFLSYYSFDFKLIGILMVKKEDYKWFTSFCVNKEDNQNIKDFKKDYINNVNKVENFIKKCKNFFSHDYKRYLYNQ